MVKSTYTIWYHGGGGKSIYLGRKMICQTVKEGCKLPLFLAKEGGDVSPVYLASCELQLSEVLDGANHLRGVGVLIIKTPTPGIDQHKCPKSGWRKGFKDLE